MSIPWTTTTAETKQKDALDNQGHKCLEFLCQLVYLCLTQGLHEVRRTEGARERELRAGSKSVRTGGREVDFS